MAKDCPRCGVTNPSEAQRCDCGYDFASGRILGSHLTNRQRAQMARGGEARVGAGGPHEDGALVYAGFWPRMLAIYVDLVVMAPILFAYFAVRGRSIPMAIVTVLSMTVLGFAYPVYFLSRWGQTIGKMAARIKVTRPDGTPIAPRHAWLRSSVDIGLAAISLGVTIHSLATWTGPEWSSMGWSEQSAELARRDPTLTALTWVSQGWFWSELVVLLFNEQRRALHDFIAGTVVIKVRRISAAQPGLQ